MPEPIPRRDRAEYQLGYIKPELGIRFKRWTLSSANCYLRDLECKACPNLEFCNKSEFAMKQVVKALTIKPGVHTIFHNIKRTDWPLLHGIQIDIKFLEDIM